MKWIKSRKNFLIEEAKLRDVIFSRQAEAIKSKWGERYLDLEEIEATDKIKQGKWKLDEEDKFKILSAFFGVNVASVYEYLGNLPDKFNDVIKQSINIELLTRTYGNPDKWNIIMKDFDVKKPTIDQLLLFQEPIFKKISVSETKSKEIIVRDENGRPVMGEDGRPTKRKRDEEEVVFTNNLVNAYTFAQDFNNVYPEDKFDERRFSGGDIAQLISMSKEDFSEGGYTFDFDVFSKEMYLSIQHKAKDILNMSISKFYASCQHLYTGAYREKVIGNVFDPNSVPAFIIFDTPIMWRGERISDQLPLCRMIIRNIETWEDEEPVIFFDRAYPDRVKKAMGEIIEKYSDNKETSKDINTYLFTPDLPEELSSRLSDPYMDRLNIKRGRYIGTNATKLYISASEDWSRVKISPRANIKEVIIENTNIPENFFNLKFNTDWVKFKFLRLFSLEPFKNLNLSSIAFDKCKMTGQVLNQIKTITPDVKKIQIVACDIKDMNLSVFESLDELQLVYTIDPQDLAKAISGLTIKKLVISGDLVSDKQNKDLINSLKRKGTKVEIVGPVI